VKHGKSDQTGFLGFPVCISHVVLPSILLLKAVVAPSSGSYRSRDPGQCNELEIPRLKVGRSSGHSTSRLHQAGVEHTRKPCFRFEWFFNENHNDCHHQISGFSHGLPVILGFVQWIGFVGKIYRKPWFLPSNIGVSCKCSHHPILGFVESTNGRTDAQASASDPSAPVEVVKLPRRGTWRAWRNDWDVLRLDMGHRDMGWNIYSKYYSISIFEKLEDTPH